MTNFYKPTLELTLDSVTLPEQSYELAQELLYHLSQKKHVIDNLVEEFDNDLEAFLVQALGLRGVEVEVVETDLDEDDVYAWVAPTALDKVLDHVSTPVQVETTFTCTVEPDERYGEGRDTLIIRGKSENYPDGVEWRLYSVGDKVKLYGNTPAIQALEITGEILALTDQTTRVFSSLGSRVGLYNDDIAEGLLDHTLFIDNRTYDKAHPLWWMYNQLEDERGSRK